MLSIGSGNVLRQAGSESTPIPVFVQHQLTSAVQEITLGKKNAQPTLHVLRTNDTSDVARISAASDTTLFVLNSTYSQIIRSGSGTWDFTISSEEALLILAF